MYKAVNIIPLNQNLMDAEASDVRPELVRWRKCNRHQLVGAVSVWVLELSGAVGVGMGSTASGFSLAFVAAILFASFIALTCCMMLGSCHGP